jgi:hypothetical protein
MQLHKLPAPSGNELSFHIESCARPALRLDIGSTEQFLLRDESLVHSPGMVRFDAMLDIELLQAVRAAPLISINARRTSVVTRSLREMQCLDDRWKGQANADERHQDYRKSGEAR